MSDHVDVTTLIKRLQEMAAGNNVSYFWLGANALSEQQREIERLTAEQNTYKNALHSISLASQNSMSSKAECGRIARDALSKGGSDE